MVDIDERHPNLECEVCDDYDHCLPRWEDDGAISNGLRRPRRRSRRTLCEAMNTLISQPMGSVIDRFEHPTTGVGTGASRVVRPSGLTSLDIETEALGRLARRG